MNRNLSEFQRNAIVILRNSGKSWQEIAEELRKRYNKTVTKRGMQYLWKKYKETGTIRDKTRSGRPVIANEIAYYPLKVLLECTVMMSSDMFR